MLEIAQTERRCAASNKEMMKRRVAVCLAVLLSPAWSQSIPQGVEKRYNNLRSLKVDFVETISQGGRSRLQESGTLYLLRPGRMRWEYTRPAGKLFLSDGKMFYLYSPNSNQVRRIKPKEADDFRAPLAFLLGKLDFHKQFGAIVTRPIEQGIELTARARTDREAFTEAAFTIMPDTFEIRRIVVTGQDGSQTEFAFSRETPNPRLEARLFQFEPPPGAEVVEAGGQP